MGIRFNHVIRLPAFRSRCISLSFKNGGRFVVFVAFTVKRLDQVSWTLDSLEIVLIFYKTLFNLREIEGENPIYRCKEYKEIKRVFLRLFHKFYRITANITLKHI